MESSPQSQSNEVSSHIAIILVTVANLILIVFFHEYIAWYTIEPGRNVTRLSILTDDYFVWLPIPIAASILAIVAYTTMIVYDNYRFRKTAEISFSIIGIIIVVALVSIFPFDFSVIPNASAADVVPIVVTVFFVLLAVFYGVTALIMFIRLRRYTIENDPTR